MSAEPFHIYIRISLFAGHKYFAPRREQNFATPPRGRASLRDIAPAEFSG